MHHSPHGCRYDKQCMTHPDTPGFRLRCNHLSYDTQHTPLHRRHAHKRGFQLDSPHHPRGHRRDRPRQHTGRLRPDNRRHSNSLYIDDHPPPIDRWVSVLRSRHYRPDRTVHTLGLHIGYHRRSHRHHRIRRRWKPRQHWHIFHWGSHILETSLHRTLCTLLGGTVAHRDFGNGHPLRTSHNYAAHFAPRRSGQRHYIRHGY